MITRKDVERVRDFYLGYIEVDISPPAKKRALTVPEEAMMSLLQDLNTAQKQDLGS